MSSKIVLIFGILIAAAVAGYFMAQQAKPRTGLVNADKEPVLAREVKPYVTFAVPGATLLDAGQKTVRPEDGRGDNTSVQVALALYTKGEARLVTALVEANEGWMWEPGQHLPYAFLRFAEEHIGSRTLYTHIYVLPQAQNPFWQQAGTTLVYRAKYLLHQRQVQAIVEYHEQVPSSLVNKLDLKSDYVLGFRDRAYESFAISLDKTEYGLTKLSPINVGRSALGHWVGELEHPGQNR